MNKENLINNLQSILETPTAPFHEYMVRQKIIDLLSGYKNVEVSRRRIWEFDCSCCSKK